MNKRSIFKAVSKTVCKTVSRKLCKTLLALGCVAGCLPGGAAAQTQGSRFDLGLTYQFTDANIVGGHGFTMQGGAAQAQGRLWHGLGVVAAFDGAHSGASAQNQVGLDLVTLTFGPRYTWSPGARRLGLFGEALGGKAWGFHGVFPAVNGAVSSGSSAAFQAGGGVDVRLSAHVSLRAIQADWLRTQMPNATTNVQNNLQLRFGVDLR